MSKSKDSIHGGKTVMGKMICTSGGWKLILSEGKREFACPRATFCLMTAAEVAEVRWERERSRNNLTALGKEEKRWNERRRTFVPRIQQRDSNKAHSTCSRSFLVQVVAPRTSFWFVVTFSPLPWAYYPVDGYREDVSFQTMPPCFSENSNFARFTVISDAS